MQEVEDEDFKRKPAITSLECEDMLAEAMKYIAENSPKQAQIMHDQFYKSLSIIERMPGIGTIYKNGMRKMLLGKFRYHIFYKEEKDCVNIKGIWHTSRGTEFSEERD
jgi:plasmid stabilization system protein ParE